MYVGDSDWYVEVEVLDTDNATPLPLNDCDLDDVYMLFESPDAERKIKKKPEFSTDGTDGKVRYKVAKLDFKIDGSWKVQVYFKKPGYGWRNTKMGAVPLKRSLTQ